MKTHTDAYTCMFFLSALLAGFSPAFGSDDFEASKYTSAGGGSTSVGSDFELSGTIGQSDAGWMAGGGFQLSGGFWPGLAELSCTDDLDGDGQSDLAEFALLSGCMGGPGIPFESGCERTDLDGDGDTDLLDFAAFQSGFGCP